MDEFMEEMSVRQLREMIDHSEAASLSEYIHEINAVDIAHCAKELEDEEIWKLLSLLNVQDIALILEQSDEELGMRIIDNIPLEDVMDVLSYMQKDDIVDLIGEMPIGKRKNFINKMHKGDRSIISRLLEYPEDSAGGIMTTAYIALKSDLPVAEGLHKIREIAPKTEVIETIYVVNSRGQLIGTADLRNFLTAPKGDLISSFAKGNVISVPPEMDQEEVARLVSKYDLNAIPVVNKHNVILGIITVDDVIDVMIEEYNEDILELGGVSKEESLDTTLWESVRLRLPWLLINLATAFLASMTVKMFENTIAQVVALSSIMTIVTGMGGNSGSQTQSIMVRAIATEEISFKKHFQSFNKEILLGIINGAINGLVTGIAVWIIYHNFYLALIIFIAMIGNLIVGGVFGFAVPVLLKKLGADPAVASSIFLTTATDVLGFFIFLSLAKLFLPWLV
ncbi:MULTISPECIES: magnesium transporter [Terrabacteria group]|uniref:magnesium transporter n=1 Tax=Bacillati TaxID=1783272 RepID=UPI001C6DDA48|nr:MULTISPECIES: magnesium transporter [Terrabacteria group]MBW9212174.1 magnesium transporter [Trueperella sp. zg.1013]